MDAFEERSTWYRNKDRSIKLMDIRLQLIEQISFSFAFLRQGFQKRRDGVLFKTLKVFDKNRKPFILVYREQDGVGLIVSQYIFFPSFSAFSLHAL